jgi:hypothetical protein
VTQPVPWSYGWALGRWRRNWAAGICNKYAANMHEICTKYAINMHQKAQNVPKYAVNMHLYAPEVNHICNLYAIVCMKHARKMQEICRKYAGNMKSINISVNMHQCTFSKSYMQLV